MKESANLTLDTIKTEVKYTDSKVYNAENEENSTDYTSSTDNWLTINSEIVEDPANRHNLATNLSNY
jgi:hypothetical protein